MRTISGAEKISLLDNPLLMDGGMVTGWLDAGSIAACDFPIASAYDKVTEEVKIFGFLDSMSEYRDGGFDTKPSHTSPIVQDVLTEYHDTVRGVFGSDWQRIQTTMRLQKIIEKSVNSPFHVDGINVNRTDFVFTSAQKITGIAAYPNPTEFLPRKTIIPGTLVDIFLAGNIRNPESITIEPVSHPGKIALFGYNEAFHREPPTPPELLGQPRLILRSFITI